MKYISIILASILFACPAFAEPNKPKGEKSAPKVEKIETKKVEKPSPKKAEEVVNSQSVADYLQEISVTIRSGDGHSKSEGSGVIFSRKIEGEEVNFIWTAAHVVDNLKVTKEVIDPKTGTKRQKVTFKDAQILKELVQNGRRVGEVVMDAEVLKYSDADDGHDLALLMVRKRGFATKGCTFYSKDVIPPIGTQLFHVGSLLGQMGSNSMTTGIVSQIGRTGVADSKVTFDQTTATAFPGSSGGGVFLTNGEYVGMVVRGAGEGFNLIVPIRRMKQWCEENDLMWALNEKAEVPSFKELERMVVEDIKFGSILSHGEEADVDEKGFLIRKYQIIRIPNKLLTIDQLYR